MELSALRDGLGSALDGVGRVLLSSGEPGIGETRLSEGFAAEAISRIGSL
ncbi:MAG: hypothetical protein Q7S58_08005 [Candidatus Binatus sp.]|nr:hypothetical protein [Candidatus Binatus sp.]